MKEAGASDFQPGDAAHLSHEHKPGGKPFPAGLGRTREQTRTRDRRVFGLRQLAPHQVAVNLPDEDVDRLARPDERVRKSSGIVAEEQRVLGSGAPAHVRRRHAECHNGEVDAERAFAGVELRIGSVAETLWVVHPTVSPVGECAQTGESCRHDEEALVLGPERHRSDGERCRPPAGGNSELNCRRQSAACPDRPIVVSVGEPAVEAKRRVRANEVVADSVKVFCGRRQSETPRVSGT